VCVCDALRATVEAAAAAVVVVCGIGRIVGFLCSSVFV
jgi:hypothetical protein